MLKLRMKNGFTLVEISIVLAIAALILTFVLIGISQASQASRDAQRRDAVTLVASALQNYAETHGGSYNDSNGTLVTVLGLYGNTVKDSCGDNGSGPNYLGSTVNAPGTSQTYNAWTGSSAPCSSATTLNSISITYNNSSTQAGYCIHVGLESLDSNNTGNVYVLSSLDKTGTTTSGGMTAPCP